MNPDTTLYPMVTCRECGETRQATYSDPTRSKMVERQLCFDCLFWTEKAEALGLEPTFVFNGHHYTIRPDDARGEHGSYGRTYIIEFNDGRTVTTNNLWHQGEVPARFRDRLPDTATFLSERR